MLWPMSELTIPWQEADERTIDLSLRAIQSDVFLNKEVDGHGRLYYTACLFVGERADIPVITVVDWRDRDNNPKPLSEGLVYEVQRMYRHGGIDMAAIERANRDLKEKKADEAEAMLEEMAKEFDRRKRMGNFAIVPRSVGLRMARDRQRAKGRKV